MSTSASRRGFLGGLAAAPAMAKAGLINAGQALGAAQGNVGVGLVGNPTGYAGLNAKIADQRDWLTTSAAEVAKNIAGLRSQRGKMVREQLHNLSRLDADLAESRSLSLGARIRLQAERNADRMIEQQSGWLGNELAEIKRQIGLLGGHP